MSVKRSSNRKYVKAAALFAAASFSVAALAGCGDKVDSNEQSTQQSATPVAADAIDPDSLIGNWQLVDGHSSAGEITPVPDSPVTLDIESTDKLSGRICNNYNGKLELTADADDPTMIFFNTGPMMQTRMACPDEAVTTVEDRYMEAINRVKKAQLEGSDLVLTGDDIELRFAPASN